jgi:signal transduction histidine kinase
MHLIHDLRNLLTVASISVEQLKAANEPDSQQRPRLDVLSHCLDSMFEMVDEFLDSTGVVPPDQSVDLNEAIAERSGLIRAAIGGHIELRIERFATECRVMARAIDLERILLNLVLNAAEAMPEGGVLKVQTRVLEPAAGGMTPATPTVRLTVSDTGRGMPREWEQQLFKRLAFDQVGGAGLGLASVNLIVLRLGGRFHLESHEGLGTRVHIDLPHGRPWLPQ